ncbi:hypothetical protein ACNTMW_06820 [Planosporangium sp. 12N6]|uniref:hypothetical protein n=1 Tax=Planosporangium spinosum TaxID=3402278 RepID=UPI003CEDCD31
MPVSEHTRPAGSGRRTLSRPGRRARVQPGIAGRVALTAAVAVGWLAVVAYGVVRFDPLWGLAALAAGVGVLALGLRGRPVIGLVPVLVGAVAWGLATGGQAPAELSDVLGGLRLVGWNALYAVPLLVAYGLATGVESGRAARMRVRAALEGRRWWGSADVPDAEPRIDALESVPAARFFQLTDGSCPHLVTAGRRAALVRATVWPRGMYTVTEAGEVHRDGRPFAPGRQDLTGVLADVHTWAERVGSAAEVTGFLVVHPASDRPGDAVAVDIPPAGGVRVVTADQFPAVAEDFLGAEPYRLDVGLAERLGEHLPIFEPAPLQTLGHAGDTQAGQ